MARIYIKPLVDELGKLAPTIAAGRKAEKRADEIKVILREHATAKDPAPEKVIRMLGRQFEAIVGALPPAKVLKFSIRRLFTKLGRSRFLRVASVTIKALEAELEPSEFEAMLSQGHGPTRPVTVHPR